RPPMWLLYADPEVDRLRRSGSGSFTPIIGWLHYGDPGMALLGRSMTPVDPVSLGLDAAAGGEEHVPAAGLAMFGALRDATPDAWGRRVIENRLRLAQPQLQMQQPEFERVDVPGGDFYRRSVATILFILQEGAATSLCKKVYCIGTAKFTAAAPPDSDQRIFLMVSLTGES
ncbi:MAG: hypothetical protein U1A22_06100, partial [Xanthomonadaceae bacterium]|nr:hypothetical protein [Xanthomonadaceae bacterium]